MKVIEKNVTSMVGNKSFSPKQSIAYGRTTVLKVTSGVQIFYRIAVVFIE
jgi:hypothetical protein